MLGINGSSLYVANTDFLDFELTPSVKLTVEATLDGEFPFSIQVDRQPPDSFSSCARQLICLFIFWLVTMTAVAAGPPQADFPSKIYPSIGCFITDPIGLFAGFLKLEWDSRHQL